MRNASILLLGLLLAPAAARAQPVQGRLLSRETNDILVGGTVHLVSVDSQIVAQALTDETGTFSLVAPAPGSYFLMGRAPGHEASTTDYFEVGERGRRVSFMISRPPYRLETVSVEARAGTREDRLWYGGFYTRMRDRSSGRFMPREQIEESRSQHISDLLRRFPSLDVRMDGAAGRRMAVRLRQPLSITSQCWTAFYLNGMPVEVEAVDALHPDDIEGIEVYANGVAPPQFSGASAACGVIAVWLRAR